MGSVGAFLAGDKNVVQYMKYNMRSQIFAKSLMMPVVESALVRLNMLKTMPELREKLWHNVNYLQSELKKAGFDIGNTNSCVTPVYMKGNIEEAMNLVHDLRENHSIFCSIVVYPVVPKGVILLRLIPTSVHTDKDIEDTIEAFKAIQVKLQNDEYKKEVVA